MAALYQERTGRATRPTKGQQRRCDEESRPKLIRRLLRRDPGVARMTGRKEGDMQTGVLNAGEGRAYWVVGDLYTILASGEDTCGAYALIHTTVPPGGGPPPHVHRREDEAFYVLEGDLAFHADGRDIRATAGSWVTLAKGSLHTFRNTGTATARMLIVVTPSGLERYFAEVGQPATDRALPPPSVTAADIERLLAVAPKYGLEIPTGEAQS
jgi:quercetin dioxygenase-like cupin family protein